MRFSEIDAETFLFTTSKSGFVTSAVPPIKFYLFIMQHVASDNKSNTECNCPTQKSNSNEIKKDSWVFTFSLITSTLLCWGKTARKLPLNYVELRFAFSNFTLLNFAYAINSLRCLDLTSRSLLETAGKLLRLRFIKILPQKENIFYMSKLFCCLF